MEKIKQFIENILQSKEGNDILVVIIVILVGLGSFELGRLSTSNTQQGIKINYNQSTLTQVNPNTLDKNNTFSALLPTEINIGFYGGEPLLEIDLIKKVVYLIKNKYIRKNITFTFSLTTNGVLLNSVNIDFLVENEFELLVSLDGNLNHNSYRTLKS